MPLDPYSAFGEGLLNGLQAGAALGRQMRASRQHKDTQALLAKEAEISAWEPPALRQGAIPMGGEADGAAATDGRTAPSQGYSGNSLRQMVDDARALAAKTGDPALYAASEGRILQSLQRRFQAHMASGANMLSGDPAAAVEEFAKASAFILDGNVPQFNAITTQDGTPVVAHTVTDPRTGKPVRTALSKDMIDSLMLQQGTMEQFVAGTAAIERRAAGRFNQAVEQAVTAYGARTDFISALRAEVSDVFDKLRPKPGSQTIEREVFDEDTGETVKITEKAPTFVKDPEHFAAARAMAESLVLANVVNTPEDLLRGGAKIVSNLGAETARDLVTQLIDRATKGDTAGQIPGLTLKGVDGDMVSATYFSGGDGGTIQIPKAVLEDVLSIANEARKNAGLPPIGATPQSPAPDADAAAAAPPPQQPATPPAEAIPSRPATEMPAGATVP